MSVENPPVTPEKIGIEPSLGEEDLGNLGRTRRNIAVLVESGKLQPAMAEKLATLQMTEQIETTQEEIAQTQEETLIKKENNVVDFGEDENGRQITMKVFEPREKVWSPKFYSTKDGRYLRIGFIASDGTEFVDPENAQVTTSDDLNDPEVQATVEVERKKLNSHLEKEEAKRHRPPEKREEFRETEDSVATMRKIANLLNRQEDLGRGFLIIEGEKGTGKNWDIDHIANLTGRPVFRFTCDKSKETPELKYILEFVTDEKGSRTVRINSTIIEALQTEGAILELDEINTMRDDVAKSLNSLGDAERAIYFGEDNVKAKAARGVLIVGLMNPNNYAGVKPLAETIKSRSRIIKVDYPTFRGEDENGDPILRSDEAELLFQYFPEFTGLKQTDFRALWHQAINGRESKNAQDLINQSRQLRLIQLKTLVNIANHIREAYRQYQEEASGNVINYNFDLRESAECAMDLVDQPLPSTEQEAENQVRKIMMEVFIPKLNDPEEKKNVEALIGAV